MTQAESEHPSDVRRVRESGMPEVDHWERLFDPAALLDALGFDTSLGDVADFGCGYGTFTLALAARAAGTVYAIDADPAMLRLVSERALAHGTSNVQPIESDLLAHGSSLATTAVDGVLIAHLLHGEVAENVALLAEARRVLRPNGQLGIVHWRRDVQTPRGPPLAIRPELAQFTSWAEQAGFATDRTEARILGEHHWGISARR